jgi:hypothetical protein
VPKDVNSNAARQARAASPCLGIFCIAEDDDGRPAHGGVFAPTRSSMDPDRLSPPGTPHDDAVAVTALPFATLLYRFLFFDWLFADVRCARNLFERHAARVHNQRMSRYLPVYLRRWSFLTAFDFGLGCLVERVLQAGVLSAWFFTWSCVTLTGMVVITVAWAMLANARLS